MDSKVDNIRITGQKAGVDYLMQAYGYDYRKALSMYRKIEYRLAKKVDTESITARQYQTFVTQTIKGSKNIKTLTYIDKPKDTFTIKYTDEDDEFKSEVVRRLTNFINRWKHTYIKEIYDSYATGKAYPENGDIKSLQGKIIDYETLKEYIDDFKRNSSEYLAGSR